MAPTGVETVPSWDKTWYWKHHVLNYKTSMYPNLIEDISDGSVDHDYDLMRQVGDKSVRRNIAATLDLPETLTISHEESGKGENRIRRSVVRIDKDLQDADGNIGTSSVYLVMVTPTGQTTYTEQDKMLNKLKSWISKAGYIAKFSAGEI